MEDAICGFDLELFTNAMVSLGYGAYFCGQWSAGPWLSDRREAGFMRNLVLFEFFPIVLAV